MATLRTFENMLNQDTGSYKLKGSNKMGKSYSNLTTGGVYQDPRAGKSPIGPAQPGGFPRTSGDKAYRGSDAMPPGTAGAGYYNATRGTYTKKAGESSPWPTMAEAAINVKKRNRPKKPSSTPHNPGRHSGGGY